MKLYVKLDKTFEETEVISNDDGSLHVSHRLSSFDFDRPQFIFKEHSIIVTGYLPLTSKDDFKFSSCEFFKKWNIFEIRVNDEYNCWEYLDIYQSWKRTR